MSLTEPQINALRFLAKCGLGGAMPAQIGEAMDVNGTYKHGHGLSAQGAGRLGGTMAKRLIAKGLAQHARHPQGFSLYRITEAGRAALASQP